MMPLSEHEKHVLEQIERYFRDEDPQFADSLRLGRPASTRRVVLGAVCAVFGFVLLLVGVSLQATALGVAGFVIMVAGGHQATLRMGAGRLGPERPSPSLPGRPQHI
jgi:Protein of unknown function (DUF3040)